MRTLRTRSLSWATQLVVPARPPPLGRRGPHPRPNLQVSILLSSRPPRLVSPSWVAGEGTKSLRAPSAREGGCHLPCVELGIGNGGKRRPCPSVRPGVRPSVSSSSLLELVSRMSGITDTTCSALSGVLLSCRPPSSPPPSPAPWGCLRHEYFAVFESERQNGNPLWGPGQSSALLWASVSPFPIYKMSWT